MIKKLCGIAALAVTLMLPFNRANASMMDASFVTPVTINGNVFDDANGLTDNTVNGTGTNAGGLLNAVLIDAATGNVVAAVPVAANGSYSFNVVTGNYNVMITTSAATVGSPAPIKVLPSNWVYTGEFLGTGPGNDGNINGILPLGTVSTNTSNANFGVEQGPASYDTILLVPGAPAPANFSGGFLTPLQGSDPEQLPTKGDWAGANMGVLILQLPTNGFTLSYNGSPVVAGNVIPNFNPALLLIAPGPGSATATETHFYFMTVDAAGLASGSTGPGIYIINYTNALPVTFGPVDATISNDQLRVNWSTFSETNNDYFEIESSADGKNFTKIGEVKSRAAGGNSNSSLNYTYSTNKYAGALAMSSSILAMLALGMGFVRRKVAAAGVVAMLSFVLLVTGCSKGRQDVQSAVNGKIYIRIAQVDIDGKKSYSKIVLAAKE